MTTRAPTKAPAVRATRCAYCGLPIEGVVAAYMEKRRRGRLPLTAEIIGAMGRDAGNASMSKGGRTTWSRADYNAAVRMSQRMWRALHQTHGEWVGEIDGRVVVTYRTTMPRVSRKDRRA